MEKVQGLSGKTDSETEKLDEMIENFKSKKNKGDED